MDIVRRIIHSGKFRLEEVAFIFCALFLTLNNVAYYGVFQTPAPCSRKYIELAVAYSCLLLLIFSMTFGFRFIYPDFRSWCPCGSEESPVTLLLLLMQCIRWCVLLFLRDFLRKFE
jgi:predicted permease